MNILKKLHFLEKQHLFPHPSLPRWTDSHLLLPGGGRGEGSPGSGDNVDESWQVIADDLVGVGGAGCWLPAIVILLPGRFQLSYDRNATSHEKGSSLLLHWTATALPQSSAKAVEMWPRFPTHAVDGGLLF